MKQVAVVRQLMTVLSSVNSVNFKSNFANVTGVFCMSDIASISVAKSSFFKRMQQKARYCTYICNLPGRKRFQAPNRFFLLMQKLFSATRHT